MRDGHIMRGEFVMTTIARNYFEALFELKGIINIDHILFGLKRCIFNDVNAWLTEKYTVKEVLDALNIMGPTKASGDDGFRTFFLSKVLAHYWKGRNIPLLDSAK